MLPFAGRIQNCRPYDYHTLWMWQFSWQKIWIIVQKKLQIPETRQQNLVTLHFCQHQPITLESFTLMSSSSLSRIKLLINQHKNRKTNIQTVWWVKFQQSRFVSSVMNPQSHKALNTVDNNACVCLVCGLSREKMDGGRLIICPAVINTLCSPCCCSRVLSFITTCVGDCGHVTLLRESLNHSWMDHLIIDIDKWEDNGVYSKYGQVWCCKKLQGPKTEKMNTCQSFVL